MPLINNAYYFGITVFEPNGPKMSALDFHFSTVYPAGTEIWPNVADELKNWFTFNNQFSPGYATMAERTTSRVVFPVTASRTVQSSHQRIRFRKLRENDPVIETEITRGERQLSDSERTLAVCEFP